MKRDRETSVDRESQSQSRSKVHKNGDEIEKWKRGWNSLPLTSINNHLILQHLGLKTYSTVAHANIIGELVVMRG